MTDLSSEEIFVKICGVTNLEDALLAIDLGCDALGFNFVATSKRRIEPELVQNIVKKLPNEIMSVGVFRDFTAEEIIRIVEKTGLNTAQMHGNETYKDCQLLAERVPFTIKALAANSPELANFADFGVDFLLLDSETPGEGRKFDWNLPLDFLKNEKLLLAGGLNVNNVQVGIEKFSPFGVDVATGIESEPGRKDPHLLKLFIETAKSSRATKY
jgi:phosphoribosylanthranilate isomerase